MKIVAQPTRTAFAEAIHDWIANGQPTALRFTEEEVEAGVPVRREFTASVHTVKRREDGVFSVSAEARYENHMVGFARLVTFELTFQ